jgi:serine/threonine protein kinase
MDVTFDLFKKVFFDIYKLKNIILSTDEYIIMNKVRNYFPKKISQGRSQDEIALNQLMNIIESINNIYVIKQISLTGLTKDQKNEVKQKSEILKKIKSKYVVKYYDSFEEEDKLNIVMEYCECGDLSEFIDSQEKQKYY